MWAYFNSYESESGDTNNSLMEKTCTVVGTTRELRGEEETNKLVTYFNQPGRKTLPPGLPYLTEGGKGWFLENQAVKEVEKMAAAAADIRIEHVAHCVQVDRSGSGDVSVKRMSVQRMKLSGEDELVQLFELAIQKVDESTAQSSATQPQSTGTKRGNPSESMD